MEANGSFPPTYEFTDSIDEDSYERSELALPVTMSDLYNQSDDIAVLNLGQFRSFIRVPLAGSSTTFWYSMYEATIDRPVKGDLVSGDSIWVAVLGGDDGRHTAEYESSPPVQSGSSYLMMLVPALDFDSETVYMTPLDGWGRYVIANDGTIASTMGTGAVDAQGGPFQQLEGLTIDDSIESIESAPAVPEADHS